MKRTGVQQASGWRLDAAITENLKTLGFGLTDSQRTSSGRTVMIDYGKFQLSLKRLEEQQENYQHRSPALSDLDREGRL